MTKNIFPFALVTAGVLALIVGLWGIHITATMVGYLIESRVVFWNVILFAALIVAGGISIGYAIGEKYT